MDLYCKDWGKPSDDEEEGNPYSSDNDESPEEDTTTPQDPTLKQLAGIKVKRKVYQRKRKQFEPPSAEFLECAEENSEERLDWTPDMYFKAFVTEEIRKKQTCPVCRKIDSQ